MLTTLLLLSAIHCPPDEDPIPLATPKGWAKEQIRLPPSFAPKMKWKGIEEIRFAPGMFQKDTDSFFSYVFVFQLEPDTDLSVGNIKKEILVYYQGLSAAVSKSRNQTVDTTAFSLDLNPRSGDDAKDAAVERLAGSLKWLEPFVTAKKQTLNLELDAWSGKTHRYLFVCASPAKTDSKIWKQMRNLRVKFHKLVR